MKKQKRTNFSEKISNIVFKGFLPILLAGVLIGGKTLSSSFSALLRTSAVMSALPDAVSLIKNNIFDKQKQIQTNSNEIMINGNYDSAPKVSEVQSDIPSDIMKLIKNAETKYANSSNDGKITEENYSNKNATSEYNGMYVRNTTKNHQINIEEYLNKKVEANITKNEPSVLIYHTHTTETYELLDRGFYTNQRSTRSENSAENMIRVGEEICSVLEKNGIKTIHDKTIYDKQYNGAYDRSRVTITKIIRETPSIQVVLDIHRDAIYQKDGVKIKPVTEINGRKAAQIMVISGCEEGNVTNFPNWSKNLTLAVHLQNKLTVDNPSLVRPLMFCNRKYNMDLMPCALLVEIGSDANTLSEAVYSAELFAQSLSELLKEYII